MSASRTRSRRRREILSRPSMSYQGKKMKTMSIMSLPDDLLLSCLARVSRLYYPTLSLVSKTFRSLVASPELYNTRLLLGRMESCLYFCLPFPNELNPRWFTLGRKPDKTLNTNLSKKSSGSFFVPISSTNNIPQSSNLIAVGSKIYGIGREKWCSFSSEIHVLDCRYHTWHKAPSMKVKSRCYSSTASVVDGKIYVAGGSKKGKSFFEWVEVFDPKTQTWSPVSGLEKSKVLKVKSFGLEGKLYLFRSYYGEDDNVVYNPKEGQFNRVGLNDNVDISPSSNFCVIGNILVHWLRGMFMWFDFKVGLRKTVRGLFGLPRLQDAKYCKMVDHGGKLAVLWEESFYSYEDKHVRNMIWCAEITLERHNLESGDEISGKVEWFDAVLTVPWSCHLKDGGVISATV